MRRNRKSKLKHTDMIDVKINYAKDENGNILDIFPHSYAKLLAEDIHKAGIECPNGHQDFPNATIVLGIDGDTNDSLVILESVEKACCHDMAVHLRENLKKLMNF